MSFLRNFDLTINQNQQVIQNFTLVTSFIIGLKAKLKFLKLLSARDEAGKKIKRAKRIEQFQLQYTVKC
jgi:hypothetical protein